MKKRERWTFITRSFNWNVYGARRGKWQVGILYFSLEKMCAVFFFFDKTNLILFIFESINLDFTSLFYIRSLLGAKFWNARISRILCFNEPPRHTLNNFVSLTHHYAPSKYKKLEWEGRIYYPAVYFAPHTDTRNHIESRSGGGGREKFIYGSVNYFFYNIL